MCSGEGGRSSGAKCAVRSGKLKGERHRREGFALYEEKCIIGGEVRC